jgi:hypothetical protein
VDLLKQELSLLTCIIAICKKRSCQILVTGKQAAGTQGEQNEGQIWHRKASSPDHPTLWLPPPGAHHGQGGKKNSPVRPLGAAPTPTKSRSPPKLRPIAGSCSPLGIQRGNCGRNFAPYCHPVVGELTCNVHAVVGSSVGLGPIQGAAGGGVGRRWGGRSTTKPPPAHAQKPGGSDASGSGRADVRVMHRCDT